MKKRIDLVSVYVGLLFVVSLWLASRGLLELYLQYKYAGSLVSYLSLQILFFSVTIFISVLMEVRLSEHGGFSLDTFFIIPTILNLPNVFVPLCVFAGEAIGEFPKEKPLIRRIFNVSQFTINATLISFFVSQFIKPGKFNLTLGNLLLFTVAAFLFTSVNSILHSIVVALSTKKRITDAWSSLAPYPINFTPLVAMGIIGILFAYFASIKSYYGAILSVFPVYLLYVLFKRTAMLEETLSGALKSMIVALEAKDPYTADHSKRVAEYSRKIAEKLGLPLTDIKRIEQAALLHDLGKIGTPEEVLYKPNKLGYFEWKLISRHPIEGASILASIPLLKDIGDYVLHHHERANGSGYPHRKKAEEIPLGAQIIAIADAYDAMRSPRPYRPPFTTEGALKELTQSKAYQFNSEIVNKLAEVVAENPHLEERPIPVCSLPEIEVEEHEPAKKQLDA